MEPTRLFAVPEVAEFVDCLIESSLLSTTALERAHKIAAQATDRKALARDLVGTGLLTAFQIETIGKRKYSELRIGNYEVLDKLGSGGMGSVFKARHRRMKRIVALKVLSASLATDETFLRRFQREVETIARLTHPNIV